MICMQTMACAWEELSVTCCRMRSKHVRPGSVLPAVAVGLLAIALVVVVAWGVIGKHRIDPDARLTYKATRAVANDPAPVPLASPMPDAVTACSPTAWADVDSDPVPRALIHGPSAGTPRGPPVCC